jgi:TRAP transporter 4TM/12TM fusion protein
MDDEAGRIQQLERVRGVSGWIVKVILCLVTVVASLYCLGVHDYLKLTLFVEQYVGFNLALILVAVFLAVPARKSSKQLNVPWYDLILAIGGLIVGGYIMIKYPSIAANSGFVAPIHVVLGVIALVLVFEAVRRTVGWALVILTAVLILYALFSNISIIPRGFNVKPLPWQSLMHYLYTDNNALIGMPLAITFDTVFPFLLFGTLLFTLGGGELLCNFALALFGRFRGGPAKVSVVSSALFGTMSGSAVANVVVDGPVTIPLMHRTGYDWPTAAAIEAIASTGGQLMPPVMGVAAFMMAQLLNLPYSQIALSAAIPALLYYFCLFVQVDREAAKKGLKAIPKEEIPSLGPIIREGMYFFIPFLSLIYTLFLTNLETGRAGMWAVLTLIAVTFLKKKTRNILREKWMTMLEDTGRTVTVGMGAMVAIAGCVIGLSTVSGLSSILTIEIVRNAGGNLLLLLIAIACTSMILGMGLPTGVCYILLAVMVGPAVVKLGITPLAAHLFIFYFGIISAITPPVCMAVYAACAIAKTPIMTTGYIAMRLGITAYLVPFMFVYSPEFLLVGPIWRIVLSFVTAVLGVTLLGSGIVGYFVSKMSWIMRLAAILAGIALIVPVGEGIPHSELSNVLGGIVGIGIAVISYRSQLKDKANVSSGEVLSDT